MYPTIPHPPLRYFNMSTNSINTDHYSFVSISTILPALPSGWLVLYPRYLKDGYLKSHLLEHASFVSTIMHTDNL